MTPFSANIENIGHVCTSVSGRPFERDSLFENSCKRPLNLFILVGRLWEVQLSYIVVWGKSVATVAPSDSPVKEIYMYVWLVNFSMHIFKVK